MVKLGFYVVRKRGKRCVGEYEGFVCGFLKSIIAFYGS